MPHHINVFLAFTVTSVLLLFHSDSQAATILALDFGIADSGSFTSLTPNDVAAGYSDISATPSTNGFGNQDREIIFPSSSLTQSVGAFTINVNGGGNGADYFDGVGTLADIGGVPGDVVEDGIRSFGPITVTITGLAAGNYDLSTFHHNLLTAAGTTPAISTVAVTTLSGTTTIETDLTASSGSAAFAYSQVDGSFSTTGGDVDIIVSRTFPFNSFNTLNGLVISQVPEPSSAMLLLAFASLSALSRRRRSP